MQDDLVRFLRDELGHVPDGPAGPWQASGPVMVWPGSDGESTKGAWFFLTIDGAVAEAIRAHATNAAAWGSVYVEATVGGTTWRTSLFPSKKAGGWLLPLKAAVRKAEGIVEGSRIDAVLALA